MLMKITGFILRLLLPWLFFFYKSQNDVKYLRILVSLLSSVLIFFSGDNKGFAWGEKNEFQSTTEMKRQLGAPCLTNCFHFICLCTLEGKDPHNILVLKGEYC